MTRVPRRPLALLTCLLGPGAALAPASAAQSPTAAEWRDDLRFLADRLRSVHANLHHTISREQFDDMVASLDERIPRLTRSEIIIGLARIVAMVGDGHTRVTLVPTDDNGFRQYPIRLYDFADGLHVQAIDERYRQAVGARVVGVGALRADEAMARVNEVAGGDNDSGRRAVTAMLLAIPEVLHGLGITSEAERATYTVEDRQGRRSTVTLFPVAPAALPGLNHWSVEAPRERDRMALVRARDGSPGPVPLYLRFPTSTFWSEYRPESAALYVQLNAIADTDDQTLRAFFDRVFRMVDSLPADRLVLDVRQNGGGNNLLNRPVLHGIIRSDRINRRGKFFVVIGRHTFSAAQNLVSALEMHTNALFVGEPSGGRPNHYGDARPVTLPHSGLVVRISTLYWQDALPWDPRPWKAPDIAAELTSDDYRANRDPALEAILGWVAPSDRILRALEAGGIDSAVVAYRAFRRDPRHAHYETEAELNELGYRLLRAARPEPAIAVFRLNVDDNPRSFNAYDSLGEAHMSAGNRDSAIVNYRRSLELNPRNRNAERMLRRLEAERR